VAVGYLLARNDTISNWWFVVLVGLVIVAMPLAAKVLMPPSPVAASSADGREDVPLELVGVARPFEPADRDMLDRELGLPVGGR
jgi:hypothetical protein